MAMGVLYTGSAFAQDSGTIETAKQVDTTSPGGVSYSTGSFNYSLPLISIGNGEWPNQLDFVLSYDSSANRYPNAPWSHNLNIRFSEVLLKQGVGFEDEPVPERSTVEYNLVFGNKNFSFTKRNEDRTVGNYEPKIKQGHTLNFNGTPLSSGQNPNRQTGLFSFISRNGDVYGQGAPFFSHVPGQGFRTADGTELRWMGVGPTPVDKTSKRLLVSNRGIAIFYDQGFAAVNGAIIRQVCAYNLTLVDESSIQDCSQSDQVATIRYESLGSSASGAFQVTQVTRPDGGTYNFEYVRIRDIVSPITNGEGQGVGAATRYHLSCIKQPGQSQCSVQNTYEACDGPGHPLNGSDFDFTGSRDRVIRQDFIDGRTVIYDRGTRLPNVACRGAGDTVMIEGNASSRISVPFLQPVSVTDRLGRTTTYEWTGRNASARGSRDTLLKSTTGPEGNREEYTYDERGNILEKRIIAKSGSGVPDIVTIAAFPPSCTDTMRKVCNKPISVTDTKGNTSNFEYAPEHGGVTRVRGPVVEGVRPETRYVYGQKYAWQKTADGGYARGDSPIWLLLEERSCTNSAMNTAGNCGNADDLVVTRYQYQEGNTSKGSNLWLLATAVSATNANGQSETLRTCYGYDEYGRKVSETQPKGTGSTCS